MSLRRHLSLTDLSQYWALLLLIVICTGVELVLSVAEAYDLAPRIRFTTYENGGFWVGLLASWIPNYPAQPYLMFLTYGFLHGGPLHLIVNMITLWSLGRGVIWRVGTGGFALLYGGTMIGGATGYALLASSPAPMVGASGALFGLAGGLLAWAYIDRYTLKEALWPVVQGAALLLVLNVVMWWALNGQLAWQTHLGGFLSGWLLAVLIDPRAREWDDPPGESHSTDA